MNNVGAKEIALQVDPSLVPNSPIAGEDTGGKLLIRTLRVPYLVKDAHKTNNLKAKAREVQELRQVYLSRGCSLVS